MQVDLPLKRQPPAPGSTQDQGKEIQYKIVKN